MVGSGGQADHNRQSLTIKFGSATQHDGALRRAAGSDLTMAALFLGQFYQKLFKRSLAGELCCALRFVAASPKFDPHRVAVTAPSAMKTDADPSQG
jgi:hypothetical protein